MTRPNPKDYIPKDFINGKYEDALEKYIDYLEKVREKEVLKAELRQLSRLQQRLSDWHSSVNEQIRLKQEQYQNL